MLNSWNIRFWEYDFSSPHWLWLLLLLPFLYFWFIRKERKLKGNFKFSGFIEDQKSLSSPWIYRLRIALIFIQLSSIGLIILAFSRPFHWSNQSELDKKFKEGIDIIIAMDVSVSMLAMDFEPNRLEVSKKVAKEFIDNRHNDRIGLVIYAGEAYTACPSTLDYNMLKKQIDDIRYDQLEGGTAIGTGLGTAVARLRSNELKSKVIILLTDGSNNAGEMDPLTAAELARAKNIRVYTIGVGKNGLAPTPVMTPFGVRYENVEVEIDENTLSKIAQITSGSYFRATDEKSLKSIYSEIDLLEKRKILDNQIHAQAPITPLAFMNWAFVLMIVSFSLNHFLFKPND